MSVIDVNLTEKDPGEEKPVASPCISVCALNMEDLCTGCFRNIEEIREWRSYSNEERRACLGRALEREKGTNPFL